VSRHDPRPEERESRADPPALAPLQSAHLSPWSDFPTSSRGIRLDIPSFALTTCVVSWLCRPCGPRCLAKSGVVTPLHRHPSRASTPPNRHCCRPGSVPGCLPRNPVPSSWFCTTSTVSSARKAAGLLHPAASHGVRRVSCFRSPRDAFHTPRRIPLDRSRTTSPWPLPPCRSLPSRSPLPISSVARVDPWRSA